MEKKDVLAQTCTRFRKNLSLEHKRVFDEAYHQAISANVTVQQLVTSSIPYSSTITAIEQALQAVQSCIDTPDPQPVGLYWNPTIATLLTGFRQLLVTKVTPQTPQAKAKAKGKPKPIKPVVSDDSKRNQPKPQPAPTAIISSVATTSRSASRSPPRSPDYLPAEIQVAQPIDEVAIKAEIRKTLMKGGPYIKALRAACKSASCRFCSEVVHATPISRCLGHKPCTPCAWWPHVGPRLWYALKSAHDSGGRFMPRGSIKTREGQLTPLTPQPSSAKRAASPVDPIDSSRAKWDRDDASTCSDPPTRVAESWGDEDLHLSGMEDSSNDGSKE